MWTFLLISSFVVVSFVFIVLIANVYNYFKYKKIIKNQQLLQLNIKKTLFDISQIMIFIQKNYPDYVEISINAKIKAITKLISTLDLQVQNKYFKRLLEVSFETKERLINDLYNINAINAPLNNLMEELRTYMKNMKNMNGLS